MITHEERLLAASNAIDALLRARKAVHLYPERNRITDRVVGEFFEAIQKLLEYQDKVTFEIGQGSILFEMEEVLNSLPGENGLVYMLYRDGITKISFRKGLGRDEAFRFVNALTGHTANGSLGDDLVSSIWEQDCRHIRLNVHEPEIFGQTRSVEAFNTEVFGYPDLAQQLRKVYDDAAGMPDELLEVPDIIELTDEELLALKEDTEANLLDRTGKALAICLELFLLSDPKEYGRLETDMRKAIEYSVASKKLDMLADFFLKVKAAYMDVSADTLLKRSLTNVFSFFSSERFLAQVGSLLDNGVRLSRDTLGKLSKLLSGKSVPVLVKLLGYLDTISARKTVVTLLVAIGGRNMPALYEALSDDKWYVVRNIVITLRQIGDRQAKTYLADIINHRDNRVRREAIKALAELTGNDSVDLLRRALGDPDYSVRQFALGALSNIDSGAARQLLMERVNNKKFLALSYAEKKEYYNALLHYNDPDVVQTLGRALARRRLFRRAANDENRAAIVYCIGLHGDRSFLPVLLGINTEGNEFLKNHIEDALRKIDSGR
jgi:hypothetical protein